VGRAIVTRTAASGATRRATNDGQAPAQVVGVVEATVRASGVLHAGTSTVVMLSGGRDSVCLLDIAARICGTEAVHVLHVNYGLRGEDSDADERHCAMLCGELGIALERVHAQWPGEAAGNLQAWARQVRYDAARTLAAAVDGGEVVGAAHARTLIASGHTGSDQVETVLYRLAASPGRRALLGMPAREGRLARPLLGLTREQTRAYCIARGLRWREDESNDSARYARSRVRHGLLPALRAIHPAAEANVLRTAALLREETALLEGLVDEELAGAREISVERLAELPAALQRLVVIRLAEEATGSFVPQAGERVGEIVALARDAGRGRAELHVGALACAVIESGVLSMRKLPAPA
jgi:tRNA(Ile)-lysidine synthase